MLPDQQGREAAAVDEQIARELTSGAGHQVRDIARRVGLDLRDLVVDMRDTELLDAVLLQKGHELAGIEVVGIVREPGDTPAS